ncbi:MAG: YlmH/Sll1252 family protein, partial [Porcipelethomonas sp.]
GIKRETVGDIVIGDGAAQIAVCSSVKDVIVGDISKIGSVGVRYREDFGGTLSKPENFREITGTAASLRLDAVAGLALNLSRSRAAEIIKNTGAEVNFTMRYDCSYILSQGDIFSVRGYGKFRLCEISGMTKKGRMHITVLKYC